jgi:hypothetical protein
MIAGAGFFCFLVNSAQAQPHDDRCKRERSHRDAQVLQRRCNIGKWAAREINGNAHAMLLPTVRR